VSEVVAKRIQQVRVRRGMTAAQLAVRCAELGMPDLTASTISNIETGRRDKSGRRRREVSVDELLVLALALDVAPVHLLVPPDTDDTPYPVTAERVVEPAIEVRNWIRGFRLLPDNDPTLRLTETPPEEHYERAGVVFSRWTYQEPDDDEEETSSG
jgi:transcriptional regulator with XRE-family HTH domain